MTLILALETATKVCSVALYKDENLIDCKEEHGDYSHAEHLAVFAKDLLNKHHFEFKNLSAIAISKGPGSYTGLRIGTSFAKGLCYSLQIPLIAIETLKGMAELVREEIIADAYICPMIDARRLEVYSALYSADLKEMESIEATVIDEQSFAKYLDEKPVYFIGDGAEKCRPIITHSNARFEKISYPSAISIGALAITKYKSEMFEDVAYFEPFYLKEFIALKGKKLV